VPSHRADTPPDAPVALRTRASAHPPEQRRRDLRARGATTVLERPDGHARRPAPVDPFPARPVARQEGRPAAGPVVRPSARAQAGRRPAQRAGALDWLEVPAPAGPAPADQVDGPVEPPVTVGALALDPSTLGLPVQQPARQTEALPSRRSLRTAAATARPAAPPVTARAPKAPVVAPQAEPAPRRGSAFVLPQVGIAGALGIATIAVPLSGAFAVAPVAKPASATVPSVAAALQPLPPFPQVVPSPATALDDVRLLPDQTEAAAVPARLQAPRVVLADRASRSDQRAVLPGCDGHVPDVTGVQNGQLPASMLCTLWDPKRQLRSDAAVAMAKLNLAYKAKFGHPVCFNDAYRSLTEQYRVKAERGGFAARPGTSEHGWGLAVDLCDGVDNGPGSPTYQWMRDNAPTYGWFNPKWAQSGGAGPYEPWHWEYFPGEKKESSGD
jgi:zinc D-Ala-D-Ala carboxypeptidase